MNRVSVLVITYNEERNIEACLESVRWADEIVVLDSFSTDGTAAICRQYTDRFFQAPFQGYGAMRNLALAHCTNDWVLAIDADERVSDELKAAVMAVRALPAPPAVSAYLVARRSHFLGQRISHAGWYPDRRPVFFNRQVHRYKAQLVHESLDVAGRLPCLAGDILHYPFKSIGQFSTKMERYSTLRAEEMYAAGRRFSPAQVAVHPAAMFFRMYIAKRGFLDGRAGLVLSSLYGYYTMLKYIKLWEKEQERAG